MSSEYLVLLEESESNEKWFRERYPESVEKFEGEHAAIYKGDVVDHARDVRKLATRVREKHLMERVLFKYVTTEKPVFILRG